ncbi:MAG TPA: PH domain-containing protein [Blastocatellia bacterium]|nr:PH domain-containing protein [Blastocatellia bacterium]
MFCSKCGQALPAGSRFCNRCGAVMPGAGEAVAGQPSPSPSSQAWGDRASDSARGGPPAPSGGGLYRDESYGPPEGEDQVVFTVRPTMMFVWVWYIIAALIVIGSAAIVGILNSHKTVETNVAVIVILAVAAIAFSAPIYKHIVRRREVFTLTNHKLEMRYGLISRTVRNIPLRNIQDVTVVARAVQRLLGIGNIIIDSASESGKIWLSQVPHPERYANMILAEMRRRY